MSPYHVGCKEKEMLHDLPCPCLVEPQPHCKPRLCSALAMAPQHRVGLSSGSELKRRWAQFGPVSAFKKMF